MSFLITQGTGEAMDSICTQAGFHTRLSVGVAVIGGLLLGLWLVMEGPLSNYAIASPILLGPLAQTPAQIEAGCLRFGYWRLSSVALVGALVLGGTIAVFKVFENKAAEKRRLEARIERLEREGDSPGS